MRTLFSPLLSRLIAGLFLVACLLLPAKAAPAPEVSDNLLNYLQVLRSDFNSAKVELVNSIMSLSEADAKKFWPLYREYEGELGKQAINRAELITEFVQNHEEGVKRTPEANARAKDMAKRWFKAQRARLDLMEKYHGKIQKSLSPLQAGQFLQIEHQLSLFVDIAIAAEMPLIGKATKD